MRGTFGTIAPSTAVVTVTVTVVLTVALALLAVIEYDIVASGEIVPMLTTNFHLIQILVANQGSCNISSCYQGGISVI